MPDDVPPPATDSLILVVDDDPDVRIAARLALAGTATEVATERSPDALEARLAQRLPDAVLLDMNFTAGAHSGAEGLDWLDRLRRLDPDLSVVLMTAYGGVALAVEALKRGAVDFVLKPWQNEKLSATLSSAMALTRARRERNRLSEVAGVLGSAAIGAGGPGHRGAGSTIIGSAPALRAVLGLIERAAPSDANVLILGESGTGKELTAREIHLLSPRARQPFVAVDLGAIPETLFESELFGHKKGAFTGADADRTGRLQAAHGGTLFLDEIGNLPLHLQRKLLTVLERREVLPVGATKPVPVDLRLICATNRPAAELLREDVFRQDLLFRIKTVEITLPPLRARREDVAPLLEHFLALYARKYGLARRRVSADALAQLEAYAWPGNVRELRHLVERATILASGDLLMPQDFPLASAPAAPADGSDLNLDALERQAILRALSRHQGNISQAAAALGLTRPALYRRMAKHGLQEPGEEGGHERGNRAGL